MKVSSKPAFLITIDTEGDNLWSKPEVAQTNNAKFLGRFQRLCEKYDLKPTYLTNYEMANSIDFVKFGREALARGACEIGMHLHAWNTPPKYPLTEDDATNHPYLYEYPDEIMNKKIETMTNLLADKFETQMFSHRAGRWAIDARYIAMLRAYGYQVDCSVTPGIDWRTHHGAPNGKGGIDYTSFPCGAYELSLKDISKSGNSGILELPVSIQANRSMTGAAFRTLGEACPRPVKRVINFVFPERTWVRPNGHNLRTMISLVRHLAATDTGYVQFMLHSSELMPGGSPRFRTHESIERLFRHLDCLFCVAKDLCNGMTLKEYRDKNSVGHQGYPRSVS